MKRAPTLFKSIEKYNGYCEILELTCPKNCNVPGPRPLPTTLQGLRSESSGLMEDVLVTPTPNETRQWLRDIKTGSPQVLLGGPGGQGTRVAVSPDTSRA